MKQILLRFTLLFIAIFYCMNVYSQKDQSFWGNEPYGKFDVEAELVDRRDANSKHFKNSDGTITAYIAAGALNYKENGKWKSIFHTIENSGSGFQNTHNSFKTFYPGSSNGSVKTVLPNGAEFYDLIDMNMYFIVGDQKINIKQIQTVSGAAIFNELTYPSVYGQGIDLRLTQNTTLRKLDYLIASKDALGVIPESAQFLVFEEKVQLPVGWKSIKVGNEIHVFDIEGQRQLIFEKPIFMDTPVHDHEYVSDNDKTAHKECQNTEHQHDFFGECEMEQNGTFLTIQTKVSLEWLLDSKRSFPVIIDPTVNCTPNSVANWTGNHETYSGTSSHLEGSATYTSTNITFTETDNMILGRYVGNYVYNSWMKFNITSVPDQACISSASVNYNVWDNAAGDPSCGIYTRIRHMASDPLTLTNAQRLTDSRDGDIYQDQNLFVSGSGNGWKNVPLSNNLNHLTGQLAANWFAIGLNTYAGASGHNSCYIQLRGYSHSNKPYLTVVYAAVNAGVDMSICSGNSLVLSGSTTDATTSTTTTGSATFNYSGSGWDSNNFNVGGTTSGMPASATITSVSITGSTGVSCSWSSMDFVVNGSYVNWYCSGTWTYNGLNGASANGQQFLIYAYDEDWDSDYITMTLSVTVNYAYSTVSSPTLSWSGGPIVSGGTTLTPTVNPTSTATYILTATTNGCNTTDQVTVTVDSPSTAPTISPFVGTVCPNTNLTLTAAGGTSGTGSSIYWYTGPNGTGTNLGTGSSVVVAPSANTTYYARREGTCNTTSDASTTINVKNFVYASNGASTSTYCTDNAGWHHFYSGDEIIFSVQGDLSSAPPGFPQATINVNGSFYQVTEGPGTAPGCSSNQNPNEERFEMARSWNVNLGGGAPIGSYDIRFYHLPSERTAIENAAINWMSAYPNCGYGYKYAPPLGFYWFKNTGSNYTAPYYDGTHYSASNGTTANGVNYSQWTGVSGFSGGSGAVILKPISALPIELTSFAAVCEEDNIKVQWVTASENNTSNYSVERSIDGTIWEVIGVQSAAGNSTNSITYEYLDFEGRGYSTVYYRLQQFDMNGQFKTFGPAVSQCFSDEKGFVLFPNPAGDQVTILLNGELNEENTHFSFWDVNGKIVKTINYSKPMGKIISVDLCSLEPGVYFVRLYDGQNTDKFVKFVKQ